MTALLIISGLIALILINVPIAVAICAVALVGMVASKGVFERVGKFEKHVERFFLRQFRTQRFANLGKGLRGFRPGAGNLDNVPAERPLQRCARLILTQREDGAGQFVGKAVLCHIAQVDGIGILTREFFRAVVKEKKLESHFRAEERSAWLAPTPTEGTSWARTTRAPTIPPARSPW